VCPSWYEPKPDQGTVIEIDPGMAFGTGSHETTRLCLNYLSGADLAEKSVIDFGCGSGILGIAASKLGARFVTGVDIDQRAVQTASENALKNGVDTFTALVNDAFFAQDAQRSRADVVIANILANTLVELSVEISKLVAPGGILMLSGILSTQAGFVRAAYEWGFIFEEFQEQDWVLLVGKRSG
jgi:ribosomal protein L11 methyltransferase